LLDTHKNSRTAFGTLQLFIYLFIYLLSIYLLVSSLSISSLYLSTMYLSLADHTDHLLAIQIICGNSTQLKLTHK